MLSVVGTRQYLDWRELRHHDLNSTEVRKRLERFCRGITNTLHKPWVSPDERKRREAENRDSGRWKKPAAKLRKPRLNSLLGKRGSASTLKSRAAPRKRTAPGWRSRKPANAPPRTAAGTKRQPKSKRWKSAPLRRREPPAAAAIEAFLGDYPENAFTAEANKLRVALQTREEAHKRAMASDDPVALKAFWDVYKKGEDVDQVRARLRVLAPGQSRQPSKPAMIGAGAAAATLIAVVAIWIATRPATNNSQVVALATPQTRPPPAPLFAHAPSRRRRPQSPPQVRVSPTRNQAGHCGTAACPFARPRSCRHSLVALAGHRRCRGAAALYFPIS